MRRSPAQAGRSRLCERTQDRSNYAPTGQTEKQGEAKNVLLRLHPTKHKRTGKVLHGLYRKIERTVEKT